MIAVLLFLAGLVSPSMLPIATIPLAVSVAWALGTALNARIDPRFGGWRARSLVALLTYLGPFMRGMQRYIWRARGHADVEQIGMPQTRAQSRIDFQAGWSMIVGTRLTSNCPPAAETEAAAAGPPLLPAFAFLSRIRGGLATQPRREYCPTPHRSIH